jgi:hypothetical protein
VRVVLGPAVNPHDDGVGEGTHHTAGRGVRDVAQSGVTKMGFV